MSNVPLEIERKFLIRCPERALLEQKAEKYLRLSQTYLARGEDGSSRRVRSSECNGAVCYTYTRKKHLYGFTREELEDAICEDEYLRLLSERDPAKNTIEKTRYVIPYRGHNFELDVYPFWSDRATLEVELSSEEEAFELPPFLEVIKEVTGDPAYLNSHLAERIPDPS